MFNSPSGSLASTPRTTINDIKTQFGLIGGHNKQLKEMYANKPVMFTPRKGAVSVPRYDVYRPRLSIQPKLSALEDSRN